MLESLAAGELSVSELATRVGCQVPNMSQHLAVLRSAGLVTTRREGSTVFYRLADPRVLEAYQLIQIARPLTGRRPPPSRRKDHLAMAEIKVATDATFEELVLNNDKPVVVDFWAAWCGPCKMVAPEMEKLAAKYDGQVDVVKVDVDANPGLSQAFNIMSIPTIAFFKPGQQPQGVVGFRPLEQLEPSSGSPSSPRRRPSRARTPRSSSRTTPVIDRGRSRPGRLRGTPGVPFRAGGDPLEQDAFHLRSSGDGNGTCAVPLDVSERRLGRRAIQALRSAPGGAPVCEADPGLRPVEREPVDRPRRERDPPGATNRGPCRAS